MGEASILVVGGGIAGLAAAVETAEVGHQVFIVEKEPYLGGRVARMNKYFPKLCPPYCGLEINFGRVRANRNIRPFTLSEVERVSGQPGNFEVTLRLNPRFVRLERCTSCGECVQVCPVARPNEFNYEMDKTRAIYLPHEMAMPLAYTIDGKVCLGADCARCVGACRYEAIDLGMKPQTVRLKVASIALTTGWKPYDATRIASLCFGKYRNVITNVMMERLAAPNGPTGGKIVRPTDGQAVSRVAFVQCAGSRDENHLPYCSAICCLASLKQALYVIGQYPDSKVFIFYIDIRTPGRYEDFYRQLQKTQQVTFVKGTVAKIEEDPQTKDLTVEAEDTLSGEKLREKVSLVVLATGMVPVSRELKIAGLETAQDQYGFLANQAPGVFAAGVAKRPMDVASGVRDGTGAALRAIQWLGRSYPLE